MKFKYWLIMTVLCVLLSVGCGAMLPTVDLKTSASREEIRKEAQKAKPVMWKIPLGPVVVEDMRFLSAEKLLVGLKKLDLKLSNKDYLLVNTETGNILWRYSRDKRPGDYSTVLVLEDLILFRVDSGNRTTLVVVETRGGKEIWSTRVDSRFVQFVPILAEGLVLAVIEGKKSVTISAYNISTGAIKWKKHHNLDGTSGRTSIPLVARDGLWHFYGGVEKLSGKDGGSLWKRSDIRLSAHSPPPQRQEDTLFLIDEGGKLILLDTKTGKTKLSLKLEQNIHFTNIYPYGKRIYLRGEGRGKSAKPYKYKLLAVRRTDGKLLWSYSDAYPSVSNLLEEKGRLFYGTPSMLIALDLKSGKPLNKKWVTKTGRTYPTHIKSIRGKIVFISELLVQAFDPISGRVIYRHGMTPISGQTTLDGLDISIKRLEARLRKGKQGEQFSWASLYSDEAAKYQNQANHYFRVASTKYGAAQRSYNSLANSDYWQSQMAYNRAQIDSAFAGAYSQIAFHMSMWELGNNLADTLKNMADAGTISQQKFFRRSILSAYELAEEGEYVFRPDSKDLHFIGVSIVHLPTGKLSHSNLAPLYQEYNLWSLIDFEKGVVYHHGLGLEPADYEFSEPFFSYNTVRVRKYKSYLIAQPIEIPG